MAADRNGGVISIEAVREYVYRILIKYSRTLEMWTNVSEKLSGLQKKSSNVVLELHWLTIVFY